MDFKTRRAHKSATLDHIIPRLNGGGATLDNLKLAHKLCNQKRGDKPLRQIELTPFQCGTEWLGGGV